jgi:uncharacterized protein (TIGR02118 family)
MPIRLVLYSKPEDPEKFLDHYFRTHIKLAAKLPGIRRAVAGVVANETKLEPAPYLIALLEWPDEAAMAKSNGTPEQQALGADVANLGHRPYASILLSDGAPVAKAGGGR